MPRGVDDACIFQVTSESFLDTMLTEKLLIICSVLFLARFTEAGKRGLKVSGPALYQEPVDVVAALTS